MSVPSILADIHGRIAAAAQRSGRQASDITLIAVSKTFGADRVREAWAAGERNFGENKVQEGLQKIADTADIPARWHLIGHLQSNKAKRAATAFACIHSVDSMELLRKIDAAAADSGALAATRKASARSLRTINYRVNIRYLIRCG